MRVLIPNGFRGRETRERYLEKGEHDLDEKLATYLIENGFAYAVVTSTEDEPQAPSIQALRQQYLDKTGKKAFNAWDVETLIRKLEALEQS